MANSRVLIANMTMVSQNICAKHPNKAYLAPNLRILFFYKTLQLGKLDCVGYKISQ